MGPISHHITPLVINSLRGEHTHTQAYRRLRTEAILRNQQAPACGGRVPGLKTTELRWNSILWLL